MQRHGLAVLCAMLLLGGCSGKNLDDLLTARSFLSSTRQATESRRTEAEAVPAPRIPDELTALRSDPAAALPAQDGGDWTYDVEVASDDERLEEAFEAGSLLVRLKEEPPEDRFALERRIRNDEEEAYAVLQSFGFYAGKVDITIDETCQPALVRVYMAPGPQYVMGSTPVTYTGPVAFWEAAPASLADVELLPGAPAVAEDVLDAVAAVGLRLRDHGYPHATLESSRYIVDHEKRTLDACVSYNPGRYGRMGRLVISGTKSLEAGYFEKLRNWDRGQPWNEALIEAYRERLSSQGLFRSVIIGAAPEPNADGDYNILVEVLDAPPRTVSGGVRFDTDRGAGLQSAWEHRNLAGEGQRLRVEAQFWEELQSLTGSYRVPGYLHRNQDFVAEAWARNENTDAYDQTAAWLGAGLDRRFWEYWQGSFRLTAEGGTLRSTRAPRSDYLMFGLPLTLRRDTTDNVLDPTRGTRAALTIAPYKGTYQGDFTATQVRLDLSAYKEVIDNERLVLAGRVSYGSLMKSRAVPASIMFYSGGGGSVRGYAYQSLGPLDADDDPLGGYSVLETNLEARIKITDEIGIVPFIDGGNVFEASWPSRFDLRWGAGLGLRYYTSIGPVRLDVATPLNKRDVDSSWQVYISIGQSF